MMNGGRKLGGRTRNGFVPRVNNVCHKDVHHDATMEGNQVVIVSGGSVIFAITGSKGAPTDGAERSRPENSGAESNGGASC